MSNISYMRISTGKQSIANQRQAISNAGWPIEEEFVDEAISGATPAHSRPGWEACAAYLRKGDTLIVYSVCRIGRSVVDVLSQINALNARGVRLVVLVQGFDSNTPAGKLALTMFAAFSAFELEIRKQRQFEGITRARAEGKYTGRKPKLSTTRQAELISRYQAGESRSELARQFGIDRTTVYRLCRPTPK